MPVDMSLRRVLAFERRLALADDVTGVASEGALSKVNTDVSLKVVQALEGGSANPAVVGTFAIAAVTAARGSCGAGRTRGVGRRGGRGSSRMLGLAILPGLAVRFGRPSTN